MRLRGRGAGVPGGRGGGAAAQPRRRAAAGTAAPHSASAKRGREATAERSVPRSLGQLGGSRAASQRALTTRLGCSACREDMPDRTSAPSLCRRAQRRHHYTFVRGGARRSCSRVQLHVRASQIRVSAVCCTVVVGATRAARARRVCVQASGYSAWGAPPAQGWRACGVAASLR